MNTWTDTCDRVIGIKFGDPIVLWGGNQTGKSYMKVIKNRTYGDISMKPAAFRKGPESIRDGVTWYTITTGDDGATHDWILQQPKELWYENTDPDMWFQASTFDLHEKLYILLVLRWS